MALMITTELFDRVGGREEAARLCGVSLWATYKWDEEGIPSKHWRTFAKEADIGLEAVAAVQPAKPKSEPQAGAA